MRRPSSSNTASAPPRTSASCARTRSGGNTDSQHGHVARARVTVPARTSDSAGGSKTSNATRGGSPAGRSTRSRNARFRPAFRASQNDRISGISAPQRGASQRTVRAHKYAIGTAPSASDGYRSASSHAAWSRIAAPALRNSSASAGPRRGTSSSITFRIRHDTGFRSLANASQPRRNASSGIEPPPANGSTTSGASSPCAAFTSARLTRR